MVIHRCGQHSRRCTASIEDSPQGPRADSEYGLPGQFAEWSSSVSFSQPSRAGTACPKLTGFCASANRSATFDGLHSNWSGNQRARAWQLWHELTSWSLQGERRTKFDPAMPRQYPRTVARKSAIRLRSEQYVRSPRRPARRRARSGSVKDFVTGIVSDRHSCVGGSDTRCDEE
jgi:hypothetical protein